MNKQIRLGQLTTPKAYAAHGPDDGYDARRAQALDTIRTGFVIRNLDGGGITENATKYHCYRLCRAAALPERGWHIMRLRHPRCDVRREPVEADAVDGPHAER